MRGETVCAYAGALEVTLVLTSDATDFSDIVEGLDVESGEPVRLDGRRWSFESVEVGHA